jgi:hypothetical protein
MQNLYETYMNISSVALFLGHADGTVCKT